LPAYAGAWYFGMIEGNFALLLFLATVVTGLYWLAERFYFLPKPPGGAGARRSSRATPRGTRQDGHCAG
jgi:signal peptidase I